MLGYTDRYVEACQTQVLLVPVVDCICLSMSQLRMGSYHSISGDEQVIEIDISSEDHLQLVAKAGSPNLHPNNSCNDYVAPERTAAVKARSC